MGNYLQIHMVFPNPTNSHTVVIHIPKKDESLKLLILFLYSRNKVDFSPYDLNSKSSASFHPLE